MGWRQGGGRGGHRPGKLRSRCQTEGERRCRYVHREAGTRQDLPRPIHEGHAPGQPAASLLDHPLSGGSAPFPYPWV